MRNFENKLLTLLMLSVVIVTRCHILAKDVDGCDGKMVELTCSGGKVIAVSRGEHALSRCATDRRPKCCPNKGSHCSYDMEEYDEDFLNEIKEECNGHQSCSFRSKNIRLSRWSKCRDKRETDYINIEYNCVNEVERSTLQCVDEDVVSDVQCSGATTIKIQTASYAVTSCWSKTWGWRYCCTDQEISCMYPVNIYSPDYMQEIRKKCDGRQRCEEFAGRKLDLKNGNCDGAKNTDALEIEYICESTEPSTTTSKPKFTTTSKATTSKPTTTPTTLKKTTTTTTTRTTTTTTTQPKTTTPTTTTRESTTITTTSWWLGETNGGSLTNFQTKQKIIIGTVIGVLLLVALTLFGLAFRNCRIKHKDLKRREQAYQDYVNRILEEQSSPPPYATDA